MTSHRDRIVDQFTRQAVPFSLAAGIRDIAALELLVKTSGVSSRDRVLDVACGPGLVVAAFADVAAHVTGVDVTPAMIARARELTGGRSNVALDIADVTRLPYAEASFDCVVSRFAVHHFQEPQSVLGEMVRVCRPGGRVVVCDLLGSEDPAKAAAFHALERVRDPSHVRARRLSELQAYFVGAGLAPELGASYQLPFELESLLSRSFPADGDIPALRQRYLDGIEQDSLGLHLTRIDGQVHGAYDVAILIATVAT